VIVFGFGPGYPMDDRAYRHPHRQAANGHKHYYHAGVVRQRDARGLIAGYRFSSIFHNDSFKTSLRIYLITI
jgi:hypothetical protein